METMIIVLISILGISSLALILGVAYTMLTIKKLDKAKQIEELKLRVASARQPNVFKTPAEARAYLNELITVIYKQIIDRETTMSNGTYIKNIIDFTSEMAEEVINAIPRNVYEGFLEYYTETHITTTISRTCKMYVLESVKQKVLLITSRMEKNKDDE